MKPANDNAADALDQALEFDDRYQRGEWPEIREIDIGSFQIGNRSADVTEHQVSAFWVGVRAGYKVALMREIERRKQ